ncbi:hypothetical protein [Streptomyces sp. CT34]|uniref:hypothetical protein n=1 Tax=Streptomyces sp. CT34 TaxID=1553907 RepID=UPI0005B7BEE5|nr:hypothetical protein [Streptomyces sp. CT34]
MRIRTAVAATAVAVLAVLGTAGAAAADGEPGDMSGTSGMGADTSKGTGNPPAMGSDNYTANNPRQLFGLPADR